eukprot:365219-Chlamydomonas_euryale.AAC.6
MPPRFATLLYSAMATDTLLGDAIAGIYALLMQLVPMVHMSATHSAPNAASTEISRMRCSTAKMRPAVRNGSARCIARSPVACELRPSSSANTPLHMKGMDDSSTGNDSPGLLSTGTPLPPSSCLPGPSPVAVSAAAACSIGESTSLLSRLATITGSQKSSALAATFFKMPITLMYQTFQLPTASRSREASVSCDICSLPPISAAARLCCC